MKADIKEKAVYSVPTCESVQVLSQQIVATSGNTEGFESGEVPFGVMTF